MQEYLPPTPGSVEPTYLYDNPALHPVPLTGLRIQQHGRTIRMVVSNPQDIDRIARTPLLTADSNLGYRNLWNAGGAMNAWQRSLDLRRLNPIQEWWFDADAISANPPLVYFPEPGIQFIDAHNGNGTQLQLDPANWCVTQCPTCNWTADREFPQFMNWYFDHCRACDWTGRPAVLLDGQHRVRGMSMTPPPIGVPNGHQLEPIFVSILCQTDLITANMAAKVFIEVSGTAAELDKSHKDFLKSKFSLSPFNNADMRRAYELAAEMNNTGAFWSMDTGVNPRNGRVSMLEALNCDLIQAAGGNKTLYVYIHRWLTQTVSISGMPAIIPLDGMTNPQIVEALDSFLTAAVTVWPGLPPNPVAAGNAPNWYRDRSTRGGLQGKNKFRVLLHLFPLITARILNSGGVLNSATYVSELAGIQNFDWNSAASNQYTYGDGGIDTLTKVFRHLYEFASYPANTTPGVGGGPVGVLAPTLNAWLGSPLDPIMLAAPVAALPVGAPTSLQLQFNSVLSLNGQSVGVGLASTWPPTAIDKAIVRVTNTTAGTPVEQVSINRNPAVIQFGGGIDEITPPTVGDVLDLEIEFTSRYNNTPTVVVGSITV